MSRLIPASKLIPVLLVVVALGGCATMVTGPSGGDSSLIAGKLLLEVSGIGTAANGADGMINTNVPYASEIVIRSEASGRTYELRTDIPSGFFSLANAEPGVYRVVELWAQVKTSNDYVTVTSTFDKSPTFEVMPGRVENLGVIRWSFTYDLTWATSTNTFSFNTDFPVVTAVLNGRGGALAWTGRASDQVAFSGDVAATPRAVALPPRNSLERLLFP
jgi:hypothetical protein